MATAPRQAWVRCLAPLATVAVLVLVPACGVARLWEPSREQVLERILPSAVQVVLEQQEDRRYRAGSGVAIAARAAPGGTECFVLTAGHTVSGARGRRGIYVLFGQQAGVATKARADVVAHRDTPHVDLAILRAETDQCSPARPGAPPVLGEPVWVLAFPWGRQMTLTSGIVSQVSLDGADRQPPARLMVDALVGYGSSGGGVFEARTGRLIGIIEGYNTARVTAQGTGPSWYIDVPMPGQTFVTPLSEIRRFLAEIGQADLFAEAG